MPKNMIGSIMKRTPPTHLRAVKIRESAPANPNGGGDYPKPGAASRYKKSAAIKSKN
jgi:hypothetical protein